MPALFYWKVLMLTELLNLAVNPGTYTPSEGTSPGSLIGLFWLIGALLIVVGIGLLGSGVDKNHALLWAGLALVGLGFALQLTVPSESSAPAQTEREYNESVREWLNVEYGVVVDTGTVEVLRNGESVVVNYDGKDVSIELTKHADGGIAVRAGDGSVLAPVGGE